MEKAITAKATVTPQPVSGLGLHGMLQRKCACDDHSLGTGKCDQCSKKNEERKLQRAASETGLLNHIPPIVYDVLRSPGKPLDAVTRASMESRFGHDFSRVRIHSDSKASESARAVHAFAYTVGRDIVIDSPHYAPETNAGRALMAHELAHTIQQNFEVHEPLETLGMTDPDDAAEKEADAAAVSALQHHSFSPMTHHAARLARYGHANSCKDDDHLKPFIWPGHHSAKAFTDRAILELGASSLDPRVKAQIESFFGKGSTDPANLATIKSNFQNIKKALEGQYNYHCSKRGDTSDKDALACKGQNAETDRSGNHDITLCFDQIKTWWSSGVPGPAWLIIHENFHRAGTWGHSWEAGNINGCLKPPNPSSPDLNNADAYACSAVIIGTLP